MLGPVVSHASECCAAPSICLAVCVWNLGPAQTQWGMGHRCGRLLVDASDEEQARAIGVSVETLWNIRSDGMRKMKKRLTRLEVA